MGLTQQVLISMQTNVQCFRALPALLPLFTRNSKTFGCATESQN
jgi:hypothetical protein